MCLILDANRFGDALGETPDARYAPLLDWLRDGGVAVRGGTKYLREIERHGSAKRYFLALDRAGRSPLLDGAVVDAEAARLAKRMACVSDDQHLVALARVSGARVVCTEDRDLMTDVNDSKLLRKPRGRVYRNATKAHVRLLHHDGGCQRPPKRRA